MVIFPEGTRTKTGRVGKFKRGAFLPAMELGLPIVPITIKGGFERLKMHSLMINPGNISMTVHQPIDLTKYGPDESSALVRDTQMIVKKGLE